MCRSCDTLFHLPLPRTTLTELDDAGNDSEPGTGLAVALDGDGGKSDGSLNGQSSASLTTDAADLSAAQTLAAAGPRSTAISGRAPTSSSSLLPPSVVAPARTSASQLAPQQPQQQQPSTRQLHGLVAGANTAATAGSQVSANQPALPGSTATTTFPGGGGVPHRTDNSWHDVGIIKGTSTTVTVYSAYTNDIGVNMDVSVPSLITDHMSLEAQWVVNSSFVRFFDRFGLELVYPVIADAWRAKYHLAA